MKVPTYEAQSARPRQGSGQFLTAQLSASAMTAPARATAEVGQRRAAKGEQFRNFAFKKAQIGADNEAQQASAALDIALQQMQLDLLQNPNMENADTLYKTKSKQLIDQFKGRLSNKLAKNAFGQRALRVEIRNQTAFSKANNARVVQQRTVLLDEDTNNYLNFATDLNNGFEIRFGAVNEALNGISDAAGDLGPEEVKKRQDKFFYSLARDSLIKAIDGGEDAETVINEFRDNKSRDQIVEIARQNLQQDDVEKITKELNSRSERLRTLSERKQKGQREEVALDFDTNLRNMIDDMKVNADMTDETVSQNFMAKTDQMMTDAIDAHQGSAESKAELSIQLKRLRSKHSINIGELQATARRDNAKRALGTDLRALVADVSRDPQQLATSLETLDKSINERASTFLNTEEEENARQGGREDLIQSALDGYLARGQLNSMRELYYSPGIQAALTPAIQEDYNKQIREYDAKQNKFVTDYRNKLALYKEITGVDPTAKQKLGLSGLADDKDNFNQAKGLRGEFEKASSKFREVKTAFSKVKAAVNATPSQANDISLVFGFMKMIDPGSVVREGEFATAQNAANIPERVRAEYNRLVTEGGRFTPKQRQNFLKAAQRQYDGEVPIQRDIQKRYGQLAKLYGIPKEQVLYDLTTEAGSFNPVATTTGTLTDGDPAPAAAPAPAQAPVQLDASGAVIK